MEGQNTCFLAQNFCALKRPGYGARAHPHPASGNISRKPPPWGPPEGTTRIVPVVQIAPKKIDAQETVIGYKKTATVVQEGKGDRGEEEVRASEGPSPEDLVVMEIVRGGG